MWSCGKSEDHDSRPANHFLFNVVCKNKTGCRFITIDAYNYLNVTNFYSKNNFKFFTKSDEKDQTRAMYYDLTPDSNELCSECVAKPHFFNILRVF